MINYNKLLNNIEILKLEKMLNYLPNYLESIKGQDISIIDVLYNLTEQEIQYRDERASRIQVTVAGFPFEKEVKDFDFTYQPGINKQQIIELESLRFIENKENILFVGSSRSWKNTFSNSDRNCSSKKKVFNIFHIMPRFNYAIKEST